jgi:FMN phosphatase YigB (HAD superfamily)
MQKENVKNIIFDLGGVILNIDIQLTRQAFEKMGITDFEEIYSHTNQEYVFDKFEIGELAAHDFRRYVRSFVPGGEASDTMINKAWNEMLLDMPLNRIGLLEMIRDQYNIYLLSNTNVIHVEAFSAYLDAIYGIDQFKALFKQCYFSNEIGLRKPNADCFEFVLSENNLVANETLFIDDTLRHVLGAQNLGIQTHHLQPDEDISTLFQIWE